MQIRMLVLALLSVPWTASADVQSEREAARIRRQFDALPNELPKVAADTGRETAKPRAPQWCSTVKTGTGRPSPSYLARSINTAMKSDWRGIFSAAALACEWPQEPSVHQAVAVIEQLWINWTGLSAQQAIETFKARMNAEKFKADKVTLCDQLTISNEISGAQKVFMEARRRVFGCALKGYQDSQPMWEVRGTAPEGLLAYLDVAEQPDELVRLAHVVGRSHVALKSLSDEQLLTYVIDQLDYQALSAAKIKAVLDSAPYKGNSFAQAVVLETLGKAQAGVSAFEAAVKQKASDPDWKELLVTAPQRGIADWHKRAAQHQRALTRSHEFEAKFWGPSKNAMKGCWVDLRKDFVGVLQTLERGNSNEVQVALSDPIASLLFSRLGACAAIDLDKAYAQKLVDLAKKTRYARGPRVAAYYAGLDALSKILADRTKFSVEPKHFWFKTSNALLNEAAKLAATNSYFSEEQKGTIKSVKKVGNGMQITWVTVKHQEMGVECSNTNRIMDFDVNGRASYYRNCVSTGMVTVDDTPNGIVVPAEFAEGLVAGAVVDFVAGPEESPTRLGFPIAVYRDKTKKKLASVYGLPL